MYSVGQVVKFLEVSRYTLKFYEDKGLAKIYVFYTNCGY